MYKIFAFIVLLGAPVLVTLVNSLVPKPATVVETAKGNPGEGGADKRLPVAVPAPPVTKMAPSSAGMPSLNPTGFQPAPMLVTGPSAPSPVVTTAPAAALGTAVVPPPPGNDLSNDDRP